MGFLNWFGFNSNSATKELGTGWSYDYFERNLGKLFDQLTYTPSELYESQPELRTVIDFLGEQAAQTGLHVLKYEAKGGKSRVRDGVIANVLSRPSKNKTGFEFIESLVKDYALNDNAYVFVESTTDPEYPFELHNILCSWIESTKGGNAFGPEFYVVRPPGALKTIDIPASQMIAFNGWSPTNYRNGSSKVHALKLILKEQAHAYGSRVAMWEGGGQTGLVISRPVDAPEWSLEQDAKFMRYLDRRKPGEKLFLKDGMTAEQKRFSAHDEDFVEASKLALNRVATIYGVSPIMIGQTEDANYSNAKIFREMLYGETLGPYFKRIKERFNSFLLPMLGAPEGVFVEFNFKEKLQASFEERSNAMKASVGTAYMTPNEARAMDNLPALEGGDTLFVQLNGTMGVPDTEPEDKPKALAAGNFKALTTGNSSEDVVLAMLGLFMKRQSSSVLGKLGAKGVDGNWWDGERWNRELESELLKAAESVAQNATGASLEGYDAKAHASMINSLTRQQLVNAVKSGDSTSSVFSEAQGSRLPEAASALIEAVLGR